MSERWAPTESIRRFVRTYRHEAHLISYPKCGRTWLRVMMGAALTKHAGVEIDDPTDLGAVSRLIDGMPPVYVKHDDNPQEIHISEISADKRRYRRDDVVFLVRDPRDVVVSDYFQATRREGRFDGTLEDFIKSDVGGVDSIIRFFNVWAAARHVPRSFCLIRYEDIHADPHRSVRSALAAFGVDDIDDGAIDHGVTIGAFDNMRAVESSMASTSDRLRPGDPSDPESFKTRRGEVGGYVDYLDGELLSFVDDRVARTLDASFGYG